MGVLSWRRRRRRERERERERERWKRKIKRLSIIKEKGGEDTERGLLLWFRASCGEAIERAELKIECKVGMRTLMQEMIKDTHLMALTNRTTDQD
jgi:hypothetical protein